MVSSDYTPERGDIVWINFNPQLGHEQKGRRPALVISHKAYNEKVGLAVFCPITSKPKGYTFEVEVQLNSVKGAVLSDQIKNLDWKSLGLAFIEKIDSSSLSDVLERINVLIN